MLALTHTTDELYATEEPAICVCGTATAAALSEITNRPVKVFMKTVLQNDACEQLETRLTYELDVMQGESFDKFFDERSRLAFGVEDCEVVGRINNIVILAREEELND